MYSICRASSNKLKNILFQKLFWSFTVKNLQKFSAFSLEFQKFFLDHKNNLFLTVGYINYQNKMPFKVLLSQPTGLHKQSNRRTSSTQVWCLVVLFWSAGSIFGKPNWICCDSLFEILLFLHCVWGYRFVPFITKHF